MTEIILRMTPHERYLIYMALLTATFKLSAEPGYKEIIKKFSSLPCGSPGCSFCDPQEEYND